MGQIQDENTTTQSSRPLHLLTIDILLADLISGRAVVTEQSQSFELSTFESRSALDWYRRNRSKWAGNVQAQDCEAIIDCIVNEPPSLAVPALTAERKRKVLRLIKLTAHRFAGLHAYGAANDPPSDFVFEPEKAITLFEGWNGSGKTSLLNAVIWCMTGHLLRAQRLPENGGKEFLCHVERDDETSEHQITPITPLPSGAIWKPDISEKVIPADTWVELSFVDEDGKPMPPIRRTQSRNARGKLVESAPDPAALGLDPIAFQLGTTMPGMIPFLQVGSASELGVAVARLTGLADLVNLARHAMKVKTRISGQIMVERQGELTRIELQFAESRTDLQQRIDDFPPMMPELNLPQLNSENVAKQIVDLKAHFVKLKADGLTAAKDVLGVTFDAEKPEDRENLESCIHPAIEQIKKLNNLPSIERLGSLKLDPSEITMVKTMLAKLREEATTLSDLASNPTLARRTQLYARVAAWMKDNDFNIEDTCAVCRSSLQGLVDPETGLLIIDHMQQVQQYSDFVSKTISQWANSWTGTLSRDLPVVLRGELSKDLPLEPSELLRIGLVDDLFKTDAFMGTLGSLRPSVEALVTNELGSLPAFNEPIICELPKIVAESSADLVKMLQRIERWLAFVEWLVLHREKLVAALLAVRRGPAEADVTNEAIGPNLEKLKLIVNGVAPISAAITLTDRMVVALTEWEKKKGRILACGKALNALGAIIPIGELAQMQVDGLRTLLHTRSEYWREKIFQNATTFSPKPLKTGMDANGVIDIHAGRDGVHAPLQHVSNASALRASLFGFYLAFREHVIRTSGGLSLLVLDDPQDLLDHDNRQRLARAITSLASEGAQIIATTHDRNFGRMIVSEARPKDLIAHRSVHPVNASRRTIDTSPAVEELDRKHQAFIKNIDSAADAQEYANEARIFLEARLGDLFDDPAYPAYSTSTKAPTLLPLFDRLRGLVNLNSNELFKSPILHSFCNDAGMKEGAEPRRILNQSHHDKASISYADVQRNDSDLQRLRKSMEKVHEEFRRYRWREPLVQANVSNVIPLKAVQAPKFEVPICPDIAAFMGQLPSGGSQDISDDVFSSSWFDDKALFYIRYDTLGFAIPVGSIAIVEVEASTCHDHNLVIARKGTQAYARRLLRPRNGDSFSLSAECTDPRNSRSTLSFEEHGIETYRVVGLLLNQEVQPEGREEAAQIESVSALNQIEIASRVREESAVPLALPGQIILCGKALTSTELDKMEGKLIAITINDGTSILKRVGARLPGSLGHLRQFETIGRLGDSVVIATEEIEDKLDMPFVRYARPVMGVIYDM